MKLTLTKACLILKSKNAVIVNLKSIRFSLIGLENTMISQCITYMPTDIGIALIEALKSDDAWIIDYEFTKNMEEFLDEIEENKKNW
ncbi:MAG: hypothetical protein ACP5MB_04980, partial [bacterium]